MAYRRSRALREFQKGIGRPRKLLELEGRLPDPPTIRVRVKSESLRGATIVLLSATFEAFLKDGIAEYIERISKKFRYSNHPKLPIKFAFRNDFGYIDHLRSRKDADKHKELKAHATTIASNLITAESFDKTHSNPNSECVETMLKNIGIGNIWPQIADEFGALHPVPLPPNVIKHTLDSYINWRNEVAHNGVASNLTRKDLLDAVLFYNALAASIDRTLYWFVCKL